MLVYYFITTSHIILLYPIILNFMNSSIFSTIARNPMGIQLGCLPFLSLFSSALAAPSYLHKLQLLVHLCALGRGRSAA